MNMLWKEIWCKGQKQLSNTIWRIWIQIAIEKLLIGKECIAILMRKHGKRVCLEGKKYSILDALHFRYLQNIQIKISSSQLKMVSQRDIDSHSMQGEECRWTYWGRDDTDRKSIGIYIDSKFPQFQKFPFSYLTLVSNTINMFILGKLFL